MLIMNIITTTDICTIFSSSHNFFLQGTKVYLNVYDLSPANDCLYPAGFGLNHSGVEVMGSEWSFASGGGIFESTPKEAPGAKFRESLELGSFDGGSSEFNKVISGEAPIVDMIFK